MSEERQVQGQVGKGGAWWSGDFANKVKVTKSDGEGLGWVAEKEFDSEAADFDISAADGVKDEGGVGRGAESARDISGERRGVFEMVRDGIESTGG
jgi:hypothetical protein